MPRALNLLLAAGAVGVSQLRSFRRGAAAVRLTRAVPSESD